MALASGESSVVPSGRGTGVSDSSSEDGDFERIPPDPFANMNNKKKSDEMDDILKELNFDEAIREKFKQEKVFTDTLSLLTDSELCELGITRIGDRATLRKHCRDSERNKSVKKEVKRIMGPTQTRYLTYSSSSSALIGSGHIERKRNLKAGKSRASSAKKNRVSTAKFQKKLVVFRYMGDETIRPNTFTRADRKIAMRGLLPPIPIAASESDVRDEISAIIRTDLSQCSSEDFEFIGMNGKQACVPKCKEGFVWDGRAVKELAGAGCLYVRLTKDIEISDGELPDPPAFEQELERMAVDDSSPTTPTIQHRHERETQRNEGSSQHRDKDESSDSSSQRRDRDESSRSSSQRRDMDESSHSSSQRRDRDESSHSSSQRRDRDESSHSSSQRRDRDESSHSSSQHRDMDESSHSSSQSHDRGESSSSQHREGHVSDDAFIVMTENIDEGKEKAKLKEMFPSLNIDQIRYVYSLPKIKRFESAVNCFVDGPSLESLRCLLSKKLIVPLSESPYIRVDVDADEEEKVSTALAYYKQRHLKTDCSVRVYVKRQPGVDTGGVRRQFFSLVFSSIAMSNTVRVFEGPLHKLRPSFKASNLSSGILTTIGTMVGHSFVMDGYGFPYFSEYCYYYFVGQLDRALTCITIDDVSEGVKLLVNAIESVSCDEDIKNFEHMSSLLEMMTSCGCDVQFTVSNKKAICECLMVHDALHKRTMYLDAFAKGLEEFGVRSLIANFPETCKSLFVWDGHVSAVQVANMLKPTPCADDLSPQALKVWRYLMKFIDIADETELKSLIQFVTGNPVPMGTIAVVFHESHEEEAISASTCGRQLSLCTLIDDESLFLAAMKAIIPGIEYTMP